MTTARNLLLTAALLTFGCGAYAQTSADQNTQTKSHVAKHRGKSAVGEYGSGVGDAGKGAAGGAGNAAKGAGDLVTLHPVKGAKAVGKGGKDVGVGAAKGTGKVVKGTGKLVTHPF